MTLARFGALRIVHHHPGRLRLRAQAFAQDPSAVEAAKEALKTEPSVRRVSANPETGSLLVEYEPGHREPDELVRMVARATGLTRIQDEAIEQHDPEDLVRRIADGGRELNRFVSEATQGYADLRSLLPMGMFAAGLYSLALQPMLPRWDALLFRSYQLFMSLNDRTIQGQEAKAR